MNPMRAILMLYIGSVFLLHGLSPLPYLAFGFFVATGALFLTPIIHRSWMKEIKFRKDDPLFGLIYILGIVPLALNVGDFGLQNIKYASLFLAMWVVAFWWVREWSLLSQIRFADISKAAAYGSLALSGFVVLEFVLANTAGRFLSDLLPFSIEEFPYATIIGSSYLRPRGFSAEAGFTSIAFECLIPLSVHYLLSSRIRLLFMAPMILPGYLLLGSAASMLCLLIVLAAYVLVLRRSVAAGMIVGSAIGALSLFAIFSGTGRLLFHEVIGRKIDDILNPMHSDGGTYSRSEAYRLGSGIVTDHPIGIGWGGVSQRYNSYDEISGQFLKGSGLISLPLEITVSAGLLGGLLFLFLLYRKLAPLVRIGTLPAHLAFCSLLWVSLHHFAVLEIWFPMIWLSMALADLVRIRQEALIPAHSRNYKTAKYRPLPRRSRAH